MTDDDAQPISCDANIPAGIMPGWEFTVQHLQLKAGEGLFLYTDGLSEAEDIHLQQFDLVRIMQVAKVADKRPKPLIEAMTASVSQFVGDAEQNDDLTMLAIQYTKS